jgi:cohesin loading factor subunit SCC2
MRSSFDPILNTIVGSLNASVIFIRTKALRALGQIVTSDPAVLSMVSFLGPPNFMFAYMYL